MSTTLTQRIERLESRTDDLATELTAVRNEVRALRAETDPARSELADRAALARAVYYPEHQHPVVTVTSPSGDQVAESVVAAVTPPAATGAAPVQAPLSQGPATTDIPAASPGAPDRHQEATDPVSRIVNSAAAAFDAKLAGLVKRISARGAGNASGTESGTPSASASTGAQLRGRLASIDLLGAGGMAIAGGLVTILGIVFFFVLATNRGWIGPEERVGMGAVASLLALAGGIWARKAVSYSQAAYASFGAGIAGGYMTLLAATVMYKLVGLEIALVAALAIAIAATVVAVWWSSEVLAALGLLGALLMPFAPAIEAEAATVSGTVFAALVFLGTAAVAVRFRWQALLVGAAAVFGSHILVLGASELATDPWATGVVVGCGLLLAASAVAWSLLGAERSRDPLSISLALGAGAVTVAAVLGRDLVPRAEGFVLLATAAPFVIGSLLLWFRRRELALALCAAAVVATGVAAANLLDGGSLTVLWAIQGAALLLLGGFAREWRMQVPGFGYIGLAVGHAVVVEGGPFVLFERGEHIHLLPGLVAISAALLVAMVAKLDELGERVGLEMREIRQILGAWAGLAGLAAASVALVSADFDGGHVATSLLWIAAGAAGLIVAGRLDDSQIAGVAAAVGTAGLIKVLAFDVASLAEGADWIASGGAAALVLLGGLGCAFLNRGESLWASAIGRISVLCSAVYAATTVSLVADLTWSDVDQGTLALTVAIAGVIYLAMSVLTQRVTYLRGVSTVLWVTALPFVLTAEIASIPQPAWQALAVIVTGSCLAGWGAVTGEGRLVWGAAVVIAGATAAVLAGITPISRFTIASTYPAQDAFVPLAATAAFVLLAYVWEHARRAFAYAAAALGLYTLSLGVLGLVVWIAPGDDLSTNFQRAHTAVTGVWALVGLGLFVAGLSRRVTWLRLAGVGVLGVSLAKLFLYDLAALSSVNRAATFLVVGAVLLLGGFLADRLTKRRPSPVDAAAVDPVDQDV